MKTLFFDCGMGAAGDMIAAALIELLPDKEKTVGKLNAIGVPGALYELEPSIKCGIRGLHLSVKVNDEEESTGSIDHHDEHKDYPEHEHVNEHEHDHEFENRHHNHPHTHSHRGMADIEHIVRDHLHLSEKVKDDVMNVYRLIAEAETQVHGVEVSEIHFHEVGTIDAIADIAACCSLINEIAPEEIIVSPICTGSGQVRCAHGILPVPAPATAYLLQGIPSYSGEIKSELCTPTGAALLKYYATSFGERPVMKINAIGYGMGKKDFEVSNCLRSFLGEREAKSNSVYELSCNIDDMTAEEIAFASKKLLENGALDVFTTPIGMKKGRPGTMITVLCHPSEKENTVKTIFRYTSTIGIREQVCSRYVLDRREELLPTPLGTVRKKVSAGYGITREKIEYDDLEKMANKKGVSLQEIKKELKID